MLRFVAPCTLLRMIINSNSDCFLDARLLCSLQKLTICLLVPRDRDRDHYSWKVRGSARIRGERLGDNRPNNHVAHQISLALESPCKIEGKHPSQLAQGRAGLIPAGINRCLVLAGVAVRTIYVDPLFRGTRNLAR